MPDQNQPINPIPSFPDIPDIPAAPAADTAPQVPAPSPPPKKNKGRILATILGIFLLVGAVGAGVILVGQRQLFQQKASTCLDPCQSDTNCETDEYCYKPAPPACAECRPKPTTGPTIPPGGCYLDPEDNTCKGSCSNGGSCVTNANLSCTCTVPPNCGKEGDACGPAYGVSCCDLDCVGGFCSSSSAPGPTTCSGTDTCGPDHPKRKCNDSGQMCTFYIGDWGFSCSACSGIASGNQGPCPAGHYCIAGNYCNTNTPCQYRSPPDNCVADPSCTGGTTTQDVPTPTPTATPTLPPGCPTAPQCTGVKAYDTNWNLLTSAQLSALTAEDKVRFAASCTPVTDADKAKFTINTVETEVTTQKPGTGEYYYEYTIPANVTSFTISAKLHSISLGIWF